MFHRPHEHSAAITSLVRLVTKENQNTQRTPPDSIITDVEYRVKPEFACGFLPLPGRAYLDPTAPRFANKIPRFPYLLAISSHVSLHLLRVTFLSRTHCNATTSCITTMADMEIQATGKSPSKG
jgi:hypothetical protein